MKEKLNGSPTRDVTLKQFNAVAAIAESGRITSAAIALGVTPPAVTLQLKLLEKQLGINLFERTPKGLRPTDAGTYILGVHSRLASLLDEANEAIIELKGIGRGRLRIGAVSAAQYFIPKIVATFRRAHPRIEIELIIANRAAMLNELAALRLDIAIMGRPAEPAAYDHHIIGDHPHVIIAPIDHKLASKRRIEIEALTGDVFITRESGSGTRLLMERTFAMARFSPKFGLEFTNTETIKQAVMAGLGIAFVSAHTVAAEAKNGSLAILRVQGFPVTRHWYAVRPMERLLSPVGQAMWRYLLADAAKFMPALD